MKRERGGKVIPGRKGVGGSLRPGQTIPDTAPPPPTEAAHQGTTAARQGHPQALTPANLALEGPEVQIVTLGNNLLRGGIYCAEESTAQLWTTVQFCLQNWLRGL